MVNTVASDKYSLHHVATSLELHFSSSMRLGCCSNSQWDPSPRQRIEVMSQCHVGRLNPTGKLVGICPDSLNVGIPFSARCCTGE